MASDTWTTCANLGDLPVDQRLNYVFGQVLGVQEFRQEQVYFVEKNRLHNRALHGYGTVWGLDVTLAGTGDDLEVRVGPGLAVDPCGQEIVVPALQCARLNGWLGADSGTRNADGNAILNAATLQDVDGRRVVYITLCYAECLTGEQPVFGEPCRSDAEAIMPTRIKDDFRLDLRAAPPVQEEEVLVRNFGALLARVELGAVPDADQEARQVELREAIMALAVTPAPPDDTPLVLPSDKAREWLRDAFRLWVVGCRPPLHPAKEPCILLGTIRLVLNGNAVDEATPPAPDDAQRPYLLHTRLLQEWMLHPPGGAGAPGAVGVVDAQANSVDPGTPAAARYDAATQTITFDIPRGERGEVGPVGVVAAQAITVDPGTPADARYDAATQTITFDIPRGEPGVGGGAGIAGAQTNTVPAGTPADARYDAATQIITFDIPEGAAGGVGPVGVVGAQANTVEPGIPAAARYDAPTQTITFDIPRGDPGAPGIGVAGAQANPVPAGSPADARYDPATQIITFDIPQGEQGPPGDGGELPRVVFINAGMMSPGTRPARPAIVPPAHPSFLISPETQVVFNWGRPEGLGDGQPVGLRLYWATTSDAQDISTTWAINWRWVQAVPSRQLGGNPNPPSTSLAPLVPSDPPAIQADGFGMINGETQLNVTEFVRLDPGQLDGRVGDYLAVEITLGGVGGGADNANLLLVELRW